MTKTNSDHWGPEKISPYPLSLKLRTKISKKLHKYVTQNVLISVNKTSIAQPISGLVTKGANRDMRIVLPDLLIHVLL